ncbi:unnamed protein product [Rhizopus stolonifer]
MASLKTNSIFHLCKQFSVIRLSVVPRALYSTKTHDLIKEHKEPKELQHDDLEALRINAKKIRTNYNLRTRCSWTPLEDERLKFLHRKFGDQWTVISKFFADCNSLTCRMRIRLLEDKKTYGKWEAHELERLFELGKGRPYEEIDDWEYIQRSLPHIRPIAIIKLKYKNRDPTFSQGRWSPEEINLLQKLVTQQDYDWESISKLIKTRSPLQCRERWHWQQRLSTKGRFTPTEDEEILKAVKTYGLNFGVICKVIGTDRTPRHVSQHYHHLLDPNIDRSAWSDEEMREVYEAFELNGSMKKTKEFLSSKRAIRDMWNKYNGYKRKHGLK